MTESKDSLMNYQIIILKSNLVKFSTDYPKHSFGCSTKGIHAFLISPFFTAKYTSLFFMTYFFLVIIFTIFHFFLFHTLFAFIRSKDVSKDEKFNLNFLLSYYSFISFLLFCKYRLYNNLKDD